MWKWTSQPAIEYHLGGLEKERFAIRFGMPHHAESSVPLLNCRLLKIFKEDSSRAKRNAVIAAWFGLHGAIVEEAPDKFAAISGYSIPPEHKLQRSSRFAQFLFAWTALHHTVFTYIHFGLHLLWSFLHSLWLHPLGLDPPGLQVDPGEWVAFSWAVSLHFEWGLGEFQIQIYH